MYGNLAGLDLCNHQHVVWHVLSFGQTDGLHGVTFNGNNVLIEGINRDSHVSISGLAFTAFMTVDNIGKSNSEIFNPFSPTDHHKRLQTV